eukprot:CAMPEP_0170497596 /NCGR_PEP_ID=MMETSP0208-20121228/25153_1 /TAXON_ID=197538 /ORGANISM="Strombidium inclinatum, Strain S3" /LENGTH=283 /DNA_ID=CAMNT_0010774459 /DNA_START=378 /DNA_END=1229 /DNA_ORIENTATION=-
MRLLDRSQLMDMMLFPANNKKMVIVPSNKEGTGFLNHCYDKQYLTGFISEKEFNAIILICSRITAKAYSKKQIIDRQKTSDKMLWFIALSTFIACVGIILLTISAVYDSTLVDYLASILLAPAILMVFVINIYTWKQGQPDPLTFNKMVKEDLDDLFDRINHYYENKTKQGVKWSTIDGHYWVEIHVDQKKQIEEFEFMSSHFQQQANENLDYILSLANVSTRGKQMLLRDLHKMEELAISEIEELEEDDDDDVDEEEDEEEEAEGGEKEPVRLLVISEDEGK